MFSSPLGLAARTSWRCAALGLILCGTASARPSGGSDACATAEPISGFGAVNFLLTGATDSPEFPSEPPCGDIARDVWFEWTAPSTDFAMVSFSSTLRFRVYAGSGCPTAGSLINCTNLTPFLVSAGATYIVRLGAAPGGPPVGIGGQFAIFNGTAAGDSCASPVVLSGPGFQAKTETHFTGVEGQSQPACAGAGGSGILEDGWYRWTSTYTGNMRFDCCSSSAATGNWKAAMYLGGSCPSGAPIACDDDSCGTAGQQPAFHFTAVTGQDYLFQVGRSPASASTSPITATFSIFPTDAPSNDECTNPSIIQGSGPFAYSLGTTNPATLPACASSSAGEVWFRWTAPATGTATFNGCNATFDQLVAVYAGFGCPTSGPAYACGDEGCGGMGNGGARFEFGVVCGAPYMLRVSLYSGSNPPPWVSYVTLGGDFTITIPDPPCASFTPYCTGDSPALCPCSNAGTSGRGCATSFGNQGGLIYGNGSASLANDTVSVHVDGISASLTTVLQGTSREGGGAGIVFGDGRLCAGGTLTRLVQRIANGGQLDYPQPGDPALSVLGMVPAASTRVYQAWYRDSSLSFCAPGTFNLTNGLEVSWTP